jgi:hypothetical protein
VSARPNTDYGMRLPTHAELRRVFGSLARAYAITGGDVPTLLFYLNNPDRIERAPDCATEQTDGYAKALREAALMEQAIEAFVLQGERPTIVETAERIGVCKQVARRLLVSAGLWPRLALQLAPESADASA